MNIRDLKYIVTVAQEKHFCRAAEICNVSQPALSGQIRKLEDRLGVDLFERTNRKVHVTEVGEAIVAKAKVIIKLSDELTTIASSFKNPFSGTFRLGMISTIAPYLSPLILRAIRQAMPDLTLVLIEGLTDDLEQRLDDGDIDAVITATVAKIPFFEEISLYYEPFWIALSHDHSLAISKAIDVCDIDKSELLLLTDGHCLRNQVLDLCNTNPEHSKVNTMKTSLETILALIEAGHGITLIPSLAKPKELDSRPRLVMRREKSGLAGREIRLLSRTSGARNDVFQKLAEIIKTSVPPESVSVRK